MRKEISAGIIAGAISAFPVAIAFIVLSVLNLVEMRLGQYLIRFPSYQIRLYAVAVIFVVMFVALAAFVGAIAGLVFAVARDKLPFRSTASKAIAASIASWFILSLIGATMGENFNLMYLALFILDASIFAYLFDRWAETKPPRTPEPFIPRPD